jgi:hypothetical protein
MRMKVVINTCYGGFGLSVKAVLLYAKYKGFKIYPCVDVKGEPKKYAPLKKGDNPFIVFYSRTPLKNGEFPDKSHFSETSIPRADTALVRVVEKLGEAANGKYSRLKVVEIPDDVKYEIDEYDGNESIHEVHRSWS